MRALAFLISESENCGGFRLTLVCLLSCVLPLAISVLSASAAIPAGLACVDCHTMHNSQNNSPVVASGAQSALLNNTCIGCHAGGNTSGSDYPYVFNSTGATYGTNTLAGGNFYWVTQTGGDTRGHNVEGIVAIDGTMDPPTPPGFSTAFSLNGTISGGGWGASERLTCAGTNGCHGRHNNGAEITNMVTAVKGGHHGDDSNIDGSSVAKSYRFLYGIVGIEDSDWELTAVDNSTDHNQYHGIDGGTDASTISYLCAECHGTYHSDKGTASPWLRHPTDFDMGNVTSKEYGNYNGGTSASAPYSVIAPVASDQSTVTGVQQTVFDNADDAIVTCISCHRAHGSPYYKLMRWDYAGGTGGDCTICHTSKN